MSHYSDEFIILDDVAIQHTHVPPVISILKTPLLSYQQLTDDFYF